MTSKTIKTLAALMLCAATALGATGCQRIGTHAAPDTGPAVIVDTDGSVTEIPSPDSRFFKGWDKILEEYAASNTTCSATGDTAGSFSGRFFKGWSSLLGGSADGNTADGTDTGTVVTTMTGKTCKPMTERDFKAFGELTTVVRSVSVPTKPDGQNTSDDTSYGKVDWSTAAQGYITFTAKGRERCFILEGPNGKKAIFTVQKDVTVKAALIDGTGTYQYAVANNSADGKTYSVQYKKSFSVAKIDGDLAPYLTSTPWGDYGNAPVAVAKADELWDADKTQFDNVEAIADWIGDLKYDMNLKMGTIDVYVNPDKVIANGGGVCNEKAKTLAAMLRSQGIPAYVQGGTNSIGGAHGWVTAWLELSNETRDGVTYSTGTWVVIESIGGSIQTKSQARNNYTPNEYAN